MGRGLQGGDGGVLGDGNGWLVMERKVYLRHGLICKRILEEYLTLF